MRTKQMNVSIPKASLALLADFTDKCKDLGLSRSEVLIGLMETWCSDSPNPNDGPLPEWMR